MNRNEAMWAVLRRCDNMPKVEYFPPRSPIEEIQFEARVARIATFGAPEQYRLMLEVIAARCLIELEKLA